MINKLEEQLVRSRMIDLINDLHDTQSQQAIIIDSLLNSCQDLMDIYSENLESVEE